jgi:hypothetical protein
MSSLHRAGWAAVATALLILGGCGPGQQSTTHPGLGDELAVRRGRLSAEDRQLVNEQEWCVVSTDERLGAMGPPVRIEVNGVPVFLCCEGCRKKALADPERTLAQLEENKARKRAAMKP